MPPVHRPPAFTYKKEQLHAESISAEALANRFGTPLYVYSAGAIRNRFNAFAAAFGRVPHRICYSVKANSNLSLLRLLAKLGAGFDVVSGGELERVLQVNKKATRNVVFSGVGKTSHEIDAALRADILLFNVESAGELELLAVRAARLRRKARFALRVNPDVAAETHPYISTGLCDHKFGIPIRDAAALYAQAAQHKYLDIAGVSVHIGSQIRNVTPFAATAKRIARLARSLRAEGYDIRFLDIGGGLGIDYESANGDDFATLVAEYAAAILSSIDVVEIELLLEPGRAIIAPAGALLTRVLYVKKNGAKTFIITDAAMNDLVRPSLYQAFHQIVPATRPSQDRTITADIVGPVCETGDFFGRDRQIQEVQPGDLLAILDTGAYGMSLASNYNSRPRPAEVLIDGKRATLIRKRETIKDLLRQEH